MEKKALGNTGFDIAPIVFGGNVFGWTLDEQESFRILDAFIDSGFDAIDTADAYSRWAEGNKGGNPRPFWANGSRRARGCVTRSSSSPRSVPIWGFPVIRG